MAVLTDQDVMEQAHALLKLYQRRMGLEEWHVALELRDGQHPDVPMGETWYDEHKREAIIRLRREAATKNSGQVLSYIMAHELAHLMTADLCYVGDVSAEHYLTPTEASAHHRLWLNAEERLVHQIAYLMGTKTPPQLWAGPLSGTAEALGEDAPE